MPKNLARAEDDSSFEIPIEGTEGEEDLDKGAFGGLTNVSVGASDWTVETILRQMDRGNIDLNPGFQRRDAWRRDRKSKFIESIILGLPIPQLVLAENKERRGSFLVIDGKQRLLSLRQFASQEGDPAFPQLKLEDLAVKGALNGKTLQDLRTDLKFEGELLAFENSTIRTVVIKGWPNESVLYLIFLRLNTGSVQLSPQELRQALHPGAFVSYVDKKSGEIPGLLRILKTTAPDFRMRDAELKVRYYTFKNFIADYRGNLKGALDSTCQSLNEEWDLRHEEIEKQAKDMEEALEATFEIFGNFHAFRKWEDDRYEGRFNRAVFDIMVFYFSDAKVRKRAIA